MDPTTDTVTVLLVDDDEDDYLIIDALVRQIPDRPFELTWVPSYRAAQAALTREEHDIYLIDYRLGAHTGLELLGDLNLPDRPEPFIILTGAGDERIEQAALKIGVSDYLVKNRLDAEMLSRVLRYSLQRKRMEQQRIEHFIELNRTKDEFIALASHQLRTPATAVKQYIGMLLEGFSEPVSEEQRSFLEHAYDANERQLRIVNDILRVAQVELGKIKLRPQPLDIGVLVGSIIEDQSGAFEARRQRLNYRPPGDLVEAPADHDRLRMALENIVDNAGKYTPAGKSVEVRVHRQDTQAVIEVRDQGVGIAPADLPRLFQKFSRVDNPLSVEAGGTGLGLYWTKHIIELHHGAIRVSSQPGQGTIFTVSLPLNTADPADGPTK